MSEKTLLKKIEQSFAENCCNGTYKLELEHNYDDCAYYVLYYNYETGETIAVDINVTFLGEVKFYSPVHSYYISNFNNQIKSVINVLRMLFDMIDSNKDIMIKYNEIEPETEETTEPEENSKDVMEVKQELNARFGKEQYFDTDTLQPKIENINHCPNQNTCCIVSPFVHCDYKYKSDACIKVHKNFIHDCEQVHKQMKAKHNPEWHHVSLATIANLDFDMLDEKRQTYFTLYRDLQQTLSYLRNCKTENTYTACYNRFVKRVNVMWGKSEITNAMSKYIEAKLSMQNVESGICSSSWEVSTGSHESRRYNKTRA